MEPIEITAGPQAAGRLDAWLAGQCEGVSRSALQGLMEQNLVTRDGTACQQKGQSVSGSVYRVQLPDPQPIEAVPQDIRCPSCTRMLTWWWSISPRAWWCILRGKSGWYAGQRAVVSLRRQLSGIGGAIRPGIVHRIDKDTSGLLVVAKNDAAIRH